MVPKSLFDFLTSFVSLITASILLWDTILRIQRKSSLTLTKGVKCTKRKNISVINRKRDK